MMFLMLRTLPADKHKTGARAAFAHFSEALVLWALTAKPPLAITAAAALLATGRWRSVLIALGLTCVSTIALWPILGDGWAGDYLQLIANYDLQTADIAYVWSLKPSTMSNLRGVLHGLPGIGDHAACQIASVFWLAALAAVVAATRRLGSASVWALAVLAYLLFCPHVSFTENIHLAIVVAAVASAQRIQTPQSRLQGVASPCETPPRHNMSVIGQLTPPGAIAIGLAFLVVFIVPSYELLPTALRQYVLFIALLAIAVTVLYARLGRERPTDNTQQI
jgi:pheromone shutdown protein TraB